MFHRVTPQQDSDKAQKQTAETMAKSKSSPESSSAPTESRSRPNSNRNIPTNERNASNDQKAKRKDAQPMNAESSENKSMPQGGYQPTPAQPQGGARNMAIPGSAPAQAPNTRPSYPGAQASNTGSGYSPQPAANNGDKKLQIGPGITLSGEIEDCEYLYVEGTVEAALKGASVLEIAEAGAFYGTVEIDEARIAGRFEGDLAVRGRLTIEETGSITGTISYKELAVEAGAVIDGKLSPIGGSAKASEGNAPKGKAKKAANERSSADNELPFSDNKTAVTAAE